VTRPHGAAPAAGASVAELLREVRRIEIESRRLTNNVMAGGYLSVFRGTGVEFDEVREYAEGDDPRTVDWNVTARAGRPFVKKFVDERDLSVVFLLDVSASMDGGFGEWSARRAAARIIAFLALAAVKNHDQAGFLAYGARVEKFVRPKKGVSQALRIVREGLATPASVEPARHDVALDFVARVLRRHAIVFLVSDFLTGGCGPALARAARRHDVIAVRIGTPELAPPAAGLMLVRDPETGAERRIDWSSPAVRADYAARVARRRAEVRQEFRRAEVDVMDVEIPRRLDRAALVRPLLRFFRMREERGAR
jgi:uncharacterized protein (DUF58 family)